MTSEENGIMGDAYRYLRDHNNPPRPGTDVSATWWKQTAEDATRMCAAWKNHRLAIHLLSGLISYLEDKGKGAGSP